MSLSQTFPSLAREWHPSKNAPLSASSVGAKSNKKVWWLCCTPGCNTEREAYVFARIKQEPGCVACRKKADPKKYFTKKLDADKTFAALFPDISAEWHFEKNTPITPSDIGKASNVFWWKCSSPGCDVEWQASPSNRTKNGPGCPACKRKGISMRVKTDETLRAKFPAIAAEWHPTKNGEATPDSVHHGKKMKVWWVCTNGHEWENWIHNRTRLGNACPNCASNKRARALGPDEVETPATKRPRKELPKNDEEYAEKRHANLERRSAHAIEIGAEGKKWVMGMFREAGLLVMPTRESCAADFLWVTEPGEDPRGYAVTVRTSTRRDESAFAFLRCNKYTGGVVVCVGDDGKTRRLWIFAGNESVMDTTGNISIGQGGRTRFAEREVASVGQLVTTLEGLKENLELQTYVQANTPKGVKQMREIETQAEIEDVLQTKFVYPEAHAHNARYDMYWKGKRVQAKTATDMGSYWQFKLATYAGGPIRETYYAIGDFDFLMVYLPGSSTSVLFVPASELHRRGLIADVHGPRAAPCVTLKKHGGGKHGWLLDFRYPIVQGLEESFGSILQRF